MLSTLSTAANTTGFPLGSIVEFGVDPEGRPIFALSSLSGHTRDIRADPRCSLTVTSPGFQVGRCPVHHVLRLCKVHLEDSQTCTRLLCWGRHEA